jgi:hypothetical protein
VWWDNWLYRFENDRLTVSASCMAISNLNSKTAVKQALILGYGSAKSNL